MRFTKLLAGVAGVLFAASTSEAADMAVKAPQPQPAPTASGYVEVYGGWARTSNTITECDTEGCDSIKSRFNGWALGGAGRANFWIAPDMSMQLDAQAEGTSYNTPFPLSEEISHFSSHSYLVGGHFNWRNPNQGLLGVFAALGDAGGGLGSILGEFSTGGSQRHGVFGGEAQWYGPQWTLYVQGGYDTTTRTITEVFDSIHAWFVRGTGRYFVTPNFKLEATGMYANGKIDFGLIGDGLTWGFQTWLWQAKAEWRFPTSPFSVFAKYQGSETRYDSFPLATSDDIKVKVTDHRVLLGLRLYMGENTLLFNDRRGATLDIIDPLGLPTSPLLTNPLQGIVECQ